MENLIKNKILIVDDDPLLLRVVAQRFRSLGSNGQLHIQFAVTAEEAEKYLFESPQSWLLLITDLNMPEKNGSELIQEVRAAKIPVKIVALSGYDDPLELEKAKNAGADEVIVKPLTIEILQRLIKS